VNRKWLDRRIDEALLAISLETGFLFVRRRVRRIVRRVAVVSGVGVATATVGVGTVGVALVVAAWWRRRAKRSAAMVLEPATAADWSPPGADAPPLRGVGSDADGPPPLDTQFESSLGP
jgi:hypothetical protein